MRINPAVALLALVLACKSEPSSLELERQRKASEPAKEKTSTTVVKTPVPYGKKLPCEQIFTAEELIAKLGKEITMATSPGAAKDATALCSIKLAGTPPSAKEQERAFNKNGRVLGVLPGDEICQVTFYCGFVYDVEEQKKRCKEDGQEVSTEIGLLTCVKQYEAGSDYRYVVDVMDGDSKCKVTVNPGPSVIDKETPMQCAAAAAELLAPSDLGGE